MLSRTVCLQCTRALRDYKTGVIDRKMAVQQHHQTLTSRPSGAASVPAHIAASMSITVICRKGGA